MGEGAAEEAWSPPPSDLSPVMVWDQLCSAEDILGAVSCCYTRELTFPDFHSQHKQGEWKCCTVSWSVAELFKWESLQDKLRTKPIFLSPFITCFWIFLDTKLLFQLSPFPPSTPSRENCLASSLCWRDVLLR